jgi:acyl-CoA reductase-like NAD-dependent aldehyde dehydrogenase
MSTGIAPVTQAILVDGEPVGDGLGVVEVANPAHVGAVVGTYPLLGVGDVDRAVAAAERAQPGWAALAAQERHDRLAAGAAAAGALVGIAETLAAETGKVLAETRLEPGFFGMLLAGLAPGLPWLESGDELPDVGQGRAWRFREPFGVVGAIAPANFPLLLATLKVVPALLAGNSVVLLAPPTAPLGTIRHLQAVADALPVGVLTVLAGSGPVLGQRLAEHERVRKVSFTGGISTGQIVYRAAAVNLKAIGLELGGNDAALVLDDCVLDEAFYRSITAAAFTAAGQVCFAVKRVYAPARRVPEIVDGIAAVLDTYVVGDPLDPSTTMGPVHTEAARERVRGLLAEASTAGGVARTCGTLSVDEDEGWYMRPVVVAEPPNTCRLVQEEQFAPVLPVVGYDALDEAIAMVNDTEYGLGSSIWSADTDRAVQLSRRIQAGGTFINGHGFFAMDMRICLTGVKMSGIGEDGAGGHALAAYTQPHAVSMPA